ncbi:hypothetical protein GDO81_016286 [Engystomops pustulosus]|uniref:Maturase K n=1 Tax=Engystomops pustulosus TaxID=76066 RepID=A0AAV7AS00_ENGPU|nr:hypothetical protein GDO81_016286 [Engystomops pustulosus]
MDSLQISTYWADTHYNQNSKLSQLSRYKKSFLKRKSYIFLTNTQLPSVYTRHVQRCSINLFLKHYTLAVSLFSQMYIKPGSIYAFDLPLQSSLE